MTDHHTDTEARPIGVFDSGVGGLSVLKALRAELPHEHFVYVADSGFAPYGERHEQFVIQRARHLTQHLLNPSHLNIKALVVACNTATAASVHLLRQDYPALPIVGVEPALKPAVQQSQTKRIGVLATRGTLNSQKFRTLLTSLADQAEFICQPCDGLADAIERDESSKIRALCAQYTCAIGQFGTQKEQVDTLVLGCTHYPFAWQHLRECLASGVQLVDNGVPVARQTRRQLPSLNANTTPGQLRLLTTGQPAALTLAAKRWLGVHAQAQAL